MTGEHALYNAEDDHELVVPLARGCHVQTYGHIMKLDDRREAQPHSANDQSKHGADCRDNVI